MKKKAVAVMLSMVMAVGLLAGCGGGDDDTPKNNPVEKENTGDEKTDQPEDGGGEDPAASGETKVPEEITLYTYYADASIEVIDKTLERLKEIYPDLTINIEHRTDSDGAVLKTRASVGELPDIFECTGSLTDILIESGDLAVLDDAMAAYDLQGKFIDGNFDIKKAPDGHYYAVDATVPEVCLVFYNTEVFQNLGLEEPKNYDEFKEVVKTLAENDIIPLALFAQQRWPGLQMYDMAVIGQGQPLGLTGLEEGTTKITDPEYLEAAKKVEELVSLGLIGKGALSTNASQAFELVGNDQAGMLINGSWFFSDAVAGGWADHIDYFEYNPFADAGKEEEVHWHMSGGSVGPGGYAVSAKGEYAEFCKQVAMDFIYYRAIAQAELGAVSVLREVLEPEKPRATSYQDYADHVADIKSTTKYEWSIANQEMLMALEEISELLNTGSYTAEQFIEELDARITEALGE